MLHCFSETNRLFLLILAVSPCFTGALDLQAKVEQLEKNYIELKEDLQAKIVVLETRVIQLEANVQKQDLLLAVLNAARKPLKDNIDINQHLRKNAILRTCHEIHMAHPSYDSGMYWIDPDGQGIGDPAIHVYCDMVAVEGKSSIQPGMTSILHDSESKLDIGHCTEPGCYSRRIKYYASDRQIQALIQLSNNCAQNIKYYCRNSPIHYNGTAYAWWNDKHGKRHKFSKFLTSCDQLSNKEHELNGVITDRRLMPLSNVRFSNPFKGSGQHSVSRLRCNGKSISVTMPSSCEDLWRMGHTLNAFYSVKGAKQMETVYCQFHKRPNEQGFQKWIGYSDVKSSPTYFYVRKNSTFSTRNVSIPFETEIVNIGNAMDLETGIFTAPRDGIYFFSFVGLFTIPDAQISTYAGVSLIMNAQQVGRTWTYDKDRGLQYRSLTVQSTMSLKANDHVWLQIISLGNMGYLYDDNHGYNHFTGFMLYEDQIPAIS